MRGGGDGGGGDGAGEDGGGGDGGVGAPVTPVLYTQLLVVPVELPHLVSKVQVNGVNEVNEVNEVKGEGGE